MGIFSPKVDRGPSPEEIAAKEAAEKKKQLQALREQSIMSRARTSRSTLVRNPGLYIPGDS